MKKDTTLLQETCEKLIMAGKRPSDVAYVGGSGKTGYGKLSWSEFAELADFEYACGFGSVQVCKDLVVVGEGEWWLERSTYDGSESWAFKTKPDVGSPSDPVNTFESEFAHYTLRSVNEGGEGT